MESGSCLGEFMSVTRRPEKGERKAGMCFVETLWHAEQKNKARRYGLLRRQGSEQTKNMKNKAVEGRKQLFPAPRGRRGVLRVTQTQRAVGCLFVLFKAILNHIPTSSSSVLGNTWPVFLSTLTTSDSLSTCLFKKSGRYNPDG